MPPTLQEPPSFQDLLDAGDGLLASLADDRWAWLPALLAGRVLTRRVTATELEHDMPTTTHPDEPVRGTWPCGPPVLTMRGCSLVSGVTSRAGAARVARRSKLVTLLDFRVAEVNALHPFREGNTRSQRVFFEQLARVAGWPIDWASIDYPAFIRARYENLRTARTDLLVDVLAAAVCEPS